MPGREDILPLYEVSDLRARLTREPFCILDWTVDAAKGRIHRGDEEVKLEPKVMEVLVYLASRPDEVITRAELEDTVWANVTVSYETLTSTVQKLRKAFKDDARHPGIIETLSKRGYRLIAPISWPDKPLNNTGAPISMPPAIEPQSRRPLLRGALLFLAIIIGLSGFWYTSQSPSPQDNEARRENPARPVNLIELPSIIVLPFDNISGDKNQEYFSDGMTEDLITDLSKVPGLMVISRSSSFSYRQSSIDIRVVAKELGARFVVKGSVRKSGGKIRINAQLIDAKSGLHIWADRYDGTIDDLFALQDKIGEQIVAALAKKLGSRDLKILHKPNTNNMLAYDFLLQGRNLFTQFSKDNTYRSRQYFKKAIKLDPSYADAYAMLAWTHVFEYSNGWSKSQKETLKKAEEFADQAIALDDKIPVAYFAKGLVFRERHEYVKALAEGQKSIDVDPNYANGHVLMATLLYYAGRPEVGLSMIDKAARLNPLHPSNYPFHRGQALFILKRYDAALNAFKSGLKQNPNSQRLRVWLAATYAQIGQQEDAEWEAEQVLMSDPKFSLKRLQQAFPFTDQAELDHIIGALRKAGFKGEI